MKHGEHAETLSHDDIHKIFDCEEAAVEWLESVIWRNGIHCGRCGSLNGISKQKTNRYWCKACRKVFNVKTNTPMQDANIPIRKWIQAVYILMTARKGVSSLQLSKQISVCQNHTWYLLQRIRIACGNGMIVENFRKLKGEVEIDETSIGGFVSRMNKKSRAQWKEKWGDARGIKGKTLVLGLKERGTGYNIMIAFEPDRLPNAETVQKVIAKYVEPGTIICTDESGYYTNLSVHGYHHLTINHSAKEYVRGMATTNGIESSWAITKRAWKGVYHHWSIEHGQLYMNEIAFRLGKGNVRLDTITRLESVFKAMFGETITYKELTKNGSERWHERKQERERKERLIEYGHREVWDSKAWMQKKQQWERDWVYRDGKPDIDEMPYENIFEQIAKDKRFDIPDPETHEEGSQPSLYDSV